MSNSLGSWQPIRTRDTQSEFAIQSSRLARPYGPFSKPSTKGKIFDIIPQEHYSYINGQNKGQNHQETSIICRNSCLGGLTLIICKENVWYCAVFQTIHFKSISIPLQILSEKKILDHSVLLIKKIIEKWIGIPPIRKQERNSEMLITRAQSSKKTGYHDTRPNKSKVTFDGR